MPQQEENIEKMENTNKVSKKGPQSFDAEQASMYNLSGWVGAVDIKDFTWSNLGKRLNELRCSKLLEKDDHGVKQDAPKGFKEALTKQMHEVVVVTISLNNNACQRNLPYQFRYIQQHSPKSDLPELSEIYMANKTWTQSEKDNWTSATALRRQTTCSLEGPWDWSNQQVLRIPYHQEQTRDNIGEDPAGYIVRIGSSQAGVWFTSRLETHYILRFHKIERGYALLLLHPGDLYECQVKRTTEVRGNVLFNRRCEQAQDLVDQVRKIFEDAIKNQTRVQLEPFTEIREVRVSGSLE